MPLHPLFLSGLIVFAIATNISSTARATEPQERLEAIVNDRDNPLAGASLAVRVGDELVFKGAAGCAQFNNRKKQTCRKKMKPETKVRFASVSKMAAAFAAIKLSDEGLLDLDKDVSAYLGPSLNNPAFPEKAITTRHLLAHVSGVRDPDEYWVKAPLRMDEILVGNEDIISRDHQPGTFFTYANLNYGLAAAVMENIAGDRFDKIVQKHVLASNDLNAGFNWSGVSKKARRNGATLYRLDDMVWVAQTDDRAVLTDEGPHFLASDDLEQDNYLDAYRPGDNATLFSPQGGLRASVLDLVSLMQDAHASGVLERAAIPVWEFDPKMPNGETDGGFFKRYGLGVQVLTGDETAFSEMTFTGHAGEAYGLYSGAWRATAPEGEDITIAFAVTGTKTVPTPGKHSGFNAVEEKLVALAIDLARASKTVVAHDDHDNDPRPYDENSNAMLDVDAALMAAAANDKKVLVVLGANWCHDSRGLAAKFQKPEAASLIEEAYELVYVDVGQRDRNLNIGARFGVPTLYGTPTVLILSSDGILLNTDSVHDWRTAYSKPYDETLAYFQSFAE